MSFINDINSKHKQNEKIKRQKQLVAKKRKERIQAHNEKLYNEIKNEIFIPLSNAYIPTKLMWHNDDKKKFTIKSDYGMRLILGHYYSNCGDRLSYNIKINIKTLEEPGNFESIYLIDVNTPIIYDDFKVSSIEEIKSSFTQQFIDLLDKKYIEIKAENTELYKTVNS
jgi:hypothetical protein